MYKMQKLNVVRIAEDENARDKLISKGFVEIVESKETKRTSTTKKQVVIMDINEDQLKAITIIKNYLNVSNKEKWTDEYG